MQRTILILGLSLVITHLHAADTPDDVFWKSVSKTDLLEEYRLYIEQFPKGRYVAEAGRRVGRLEAKQEAEMLRVKPVPLIAERYRDNGDGTVTDITTKLQWMRCAMGQTWTGSTCQGEASRHNWEDARQLPSNFAGNSDWRLPTIDELGSLVLCSSGTPSNWTKEGRGCAGTNQKPTIEGTAFPSTPSSDVWSGSPGANNSSSAWVVNFYSGYAYPDYRSTGNGVRLVRGGQ